MSRKPYEVVDVIIADDVRQENTNKLLIVGMYLGAVIVPSLPAVLPTLAFITKWRSKDGSLPPGIYKLINPKGEAIVEIANAAVQPGSKKPFILGINKFLPVILGQEGPHRWTFTPTGGRAQSLAEFVVLTAKQATAT